MERPRGPDLSGLKIDECARRDPGRRRWVWVLAVGVGAVLLVGAVAVFVLGDNTPVVEVVTVRENRGGRGALLTASGYVTPGGVPAHRRGLTGAVIPMRTITARHECGHRTEFSPLWLIDAALERGGVIALQSEH